MPNPASRHQTLSFLRRRFAEAGIHLRSRLGQNFLVDMNLQRLLLETAKLGPDDVVLEVGTGTGSLTALIASEAAAVVTVELDRDLFDLAGEALHALENVTMLRLDALKNKNRLQPAMLEAVDRELEAAPGRRFKLVANLPYSAATPTLTNLLALERPPRTMTVTIQKELADRIVARPGTKDYGCRVNAGCGSFGSWGRRPSGPVPRSIRRSCRSRWRTGCGAGFGTGRFFTGLCGRCFFIAGSSCAPSCLVHSRVGSRSPRSTGSWPAWDWTARSGRSSWRWRPCWP